MSARGLRILSDNIPRVFTSIKRITRRWNDLALLYYRQPVQPVRYPSFIEKSGIPVEINKPSSSGIVISYGGKTPGGYVIFDSGKWDTKLHLWKHFPAIRHNSLVWIPHETCTEDPVIAYFKNATSGYPCVNPDKAWFYLRDRYFQRDRYLLSGHLDTIRSTLDPSAKKRTRIQPRRRFSWKYAIRCNPLSAVRNWSSPLPGNLSGRKENRSLSAWLTMWTR